MHTSRSSDTVRTGACSPALRPFPYGITGSSVDRIGSGRDKSTQRVAWRCRVILLAHEGTSNNVIAQQLGLSRPR